MLTLKEQNKIKEYLEGKGIDVKNESDYSCLAESEFYENLMYKYRLFWNKGEITTLEKYMESKQ